MSASMPLKLETTKRSRLVVVETVAHQDALCQPTSVDAGSFSVELATTEQPFTRRMPVGTEWRPLETGHLDECSQMLIVATDTAVEVDVGGGMWHLGPKQSMRGRPSDLMSVRIRSEKEARVYVYLWPA